MLQSIEGFLADLSFFPSFLFRLWAPWVPLVSFASFGSFRSLRSFRAAFLGPTSLLVRPQKGEETLILKPVVSGTSGVLFLDSGGALSPPDFALAPLVEGLHPESQQSPLPDLGLTHSLTVDWVAWLLLSPSFLQHLPPAQAPKLGGPLLELPVLDLWLQPFVFHVSQLCVHHLRLKGLEHLIGSILSIQWTGKRLVVQLAYPTEVDNILADIVLKVHSYNLPVFICAFADLKVFSNGLCTLVSIISVPSRLPYPLGIHLSKQMR